MIRVRACFYETTGSCCALPQLRKIGWDTRVQKKAGGLRRTDLENKVRSQAEVGDDPEQRID